MMMAFRLQCGPQKGEERSGCRLGNDGGTGRPVEGAQRGHETARIVSRAACGRRRHRRPRSEGLREAGGGRLRRAMGDGTAMSIAMHVCSMQTWKLSPAAKIRQIGGRTSVGLTSELS
jgi:hypothetical protein